MLLKLFLSLDDLYRMLLIFNRIEFNTLNFKLMTWCTHARAPSRSTLECWNNIKILNWEWTIPFVQKICINVSTLILISPSSHIFQPPFRTMAPGIAHWLNTGCLGHLKLNRHFLKSIFDLLTLNRFPNGFLHSTRGRQKKNSRIFSSTLPTP